MVLEYRLQVIVDLLELIVFAAIQKAIPVRRF